MKGEYLTALKQAALLGAIKGYVSVTTKQLGEQIGMTQQGASRILLLLAEDGLIDRQLNHGRQRIKLTDKGISELKREYEDYKLLFEQAMTLVIRGTVSSGLGEGRYYISQTGYKKQLKEKMHFMPYEGTLNLKVLNSDIPTFELLERSPGIRINGFVSKGRTFGDVKCFPAKVNGVACAVILPARTHYTDVMELIAERQLRSLLSLKDGDLLEVFVSLQV
ncbi:MAG: DUF120 domain-containing protein [Methanomassiliicoccales archaeon]